MSMYEEITNGGRDEKELEEEKRMAQNKFQEEQPSSQHNEKQLAMFEKCKKQRRNRRREEEESSDDEEDSRLVCNMIGEQWESMPFPVIVDSGACASVMPSRWCEHVPIIETPQSQAGEYFRAANG